MCTERERERERERTIQIMLIYKIMLGFLVRGIVLSFHIVQAQSLILFKAPLVVLNGHMGVSIRSIHILKGGGGGGGGTHILKGGGGGAGSGTHILKGRGGHTF